jgi:hypothetical protein
MISSSKCFLPKTSEGYNFNVIGTETITENYPTLTTAEFPSQP